MSLNRSAESNRLTDTQANVTPYTIPSLIWELVEPYLTKYGVSFSEAYPQTRVAAPTVVWRISRRIPGISASPYRQKKGANFSREVKTDEDGNVHQEYTQHFTIWYEFAIFGVSTAEINQLAWDFETAVVAAAGRLEATFPGFKIVFSYQNTDNAMTWRQQDELNYRSIVFETILPIRYLHVSQAVRSIQLETIQGRRRTYERVTRTADTTYSPTTTDNEIVSSINFVFINRSGRKTLREGVDFTTKETESGSFYLEWEDTYGMTPAVGEDFVVDYDVMQKFGIPVYKQDSGYPD